MSMPKIECADIDICCAASSLIQSIALEETAISHILNAEGEKLQKVIGMHQCSHHDLMEANKSVEDLVDKVTALEVILKSKLDLVIPIIERCCDEPKCRKPKCDKPKCDKYDCDKPGYDNPEYDKPEYLN